MNFKASHISLSFDESPIVIRRASFLRLQVLFTPVFNYLAQKFISKSHMRVFVYKF